MQFEYPVGSTPIDPSEAEGLIPRIHTQRELNQLEAMNIAKAASWLARNKRIRTDLLAIENLQLVHRKMFGDVWKWAGKFRSTQKNIGVESWRVTSELRNLKDDVAIWREYGTYPLLEIIARIHHRLVWIHPFANGNGRFGRIITDLCSEQFGLSRPTWGFQASRSTKELRADYLSALRQADGGDTAPLVNFLWT